MTRNEALKVIRASVAQGTATPIFESDRNAAILLLAHGLENSTIEPLPANINGVAYSDTGLLEALAGQTALVIARSGDNWLGYLPSTQEFFLAYGPESSQLNALGFHSTDALAEWQG
jgi:hypothetical protein